MFKLEKVFQNDDYGYYFFIGFFKALILFISIYLFSILKNNSIYEILNFEIFKNSQYFLYAVLLSIFFFFGSIYLKKKEYRKNFISFLKEDILNFIVCNIFVFSIFFLFKINFEINIITLYFGIYLFVILGILKLYFNNLYLRLIEKNIIQKNIMLVGTYDEIKKILEVKFDKIFVFKCCLLTDYKNIDIRLIRSELKFTIFNSQ